MRRCIELAQLGAGKVAPNPMVGAVLVHSGRIIGEGYHQQYGEAHAEVNCIYDVKPDDQKLLSASVLYVSLEPCAHHGKTPPCSDLIIQKKIPVVVIGCRDPFTKVDGKGIDKLKNAGVEVEIGILEPECKTLNKRFLTFVTKKRPYIILKWAQTANGKIAADINERLLITNEYTNRMVHQWRSEEAAILVGTNTALLDNPSLTNRLWYGKDPVRMVLDMNLRLPSTLKIFDQQQKTIVFNGLKQEENKNIIFQFINKKDDIIHQILNNTYERKLQSILVEGGAQLLQSFMDAGCWDESRVITNDALTITGGLPAPLFKHDSPVGVEKIATDTIYYYTNK
ncbi:MAG: bifunctional diaminohydroxyphosphoribosylaminopyrimidine deaminase/5-amino-6-(5-phosphoribosylamino)uracil reductase RibD [Sediminibacterium sp.]